jgi:hypothetical protein
LKVYINQRIHKFRIKIRKSKESIFNTNIINKYINSELKIRKILVDLKKEEFGVLDFLKI